MRGNTSQLQRLPEANLVIIVNYNGGLCQSIEVFAYCTYHECGMVTSLLQNGNYGSLSIQPAESS